MAIEVFRIEQGLGVEVGWGCKGVYEWIEDGSVMDVAVEEGRIKLILDKIVGTGVLSEME